MRAKHPHGDQQTFTCKAKRHQLVAVSPLCCAVAGRASQSILACPPVDSGSPTPPTSPAPPPTPGIIAGWSDQARLSQKSKSKKNNNNALHHWLLFIAHSKGLSRSFPFAFHGKLVFSFCVSFHWASAVKVLLEPACCKRDEGFRQKNEPSWGKLSQAEPS